MFEGVDDSKGGKLLGALARCNKRGSTWRSHTLHAAHPKEFVASEFRPLLDRDVAFLVRPLLDLGDEEALAEPTPNSNTCESTPN